MTAETNFFRQKNLILIIVLAAAAFAVFANTLGGEFVYDDKRQIAQNPLIQDPSNFGKALTSDVWAFKGDGRLAGSNYYRPAFTAWLILNFQLFGQNPAGWHLLNILLHAAVCLLAFLFLRRLEVSENLAFAIALIFAVHPVHTESVAWISGAPDPLFALFLLASLMFAEKAAREKPGKQSLNLIVSVLFYALALGAKEIGVLCVPLYFLIFRQNSTKSDNYNKSDIYKTLPFFGAALFYLAARYFALGAFSLPTEDGASLGETILTIPAMLVFYLKQMIFPVSLAANHDLRIVSVISPVKFVLPLIISCAVFTALWFSAKRSFVQRFGFALLVLTLLPALNATAFPPEQIVHDRYLYLPLLGFLMIVFPFLAEMAEKFAKEKKEFAIAVLAVAAALPLAAKTVVYNRIWTDELALWTHAVEADSNSAFNLSQLGAVLSETGRTSAAIEAYQRSVTVRPTALGLMGLGRNLAALGRNDEAVVHLKAVIAMPNEKVNAYTLFQAYEALALALDGQNDLAEAGKILREARTRLPIYHAALTEKLAVVLYRQNRKAEALNELESAQMRAENELLPAAKTVFLRLGQLYAETGKRAEARAALEKFLRSTAQMEDKITLEDRRQAAQMLARLK